MNNEVLFMPLGGGQSVGASCYYLRLGNHNILLDAGIGIDKGVVYGPRFASLFELPFLHSFSEISQIFISHAHMDHIGSLLTLLKEVGDTSVYMTTMTAILTEYQLYDRRFNGQWNISEEAARLAVKYLLDKISKVSFLETLDFNNYKVSIYPAGHIPGAAMFLFEFKGRRILYTGDLSSKNTLLTEACMIPQHPIDVLILCGLHAKHPQCTSSQEDPLIHLTLKAKRLLFQKKCPLVCELLQLSKGIEFLKSLQLYNFDDFHIYLDFTLKSLIEKLEQLSMPIINRHTHFYQPGQEIPENSIILTSSAKAYTNNINFQRMHVDFSLHDNYHETINFIKAINPKQVIIVHCDSSDDNNYLEQELLFDGDCQTQVIYAEEGMSYKV